jgi:hypothetical protein
MEQFPYIKPMGLGEILDTSVKLYRKHFRLLVIAQLPMTTFYIVVTLIETYGFGESIPSSFAFLRPDQVLEPLLDPSLRYIPPLLFLVQLILVKPLALSAVTKVASDSLLKTPSVKEAYTFYIQFWWKLGLTYFIPILLLALVILVFEYLLPILGLMIVVFFWTRWVVAVPAAVNDGTFMVRSMKRSWNLVTGHTLKVFLAMGIMASLPFIMELSPIFIELFLGKLLIFLLIVFGTFSEGIIVPLIDVTRVVTYFELRTRHEGFDIEQRVETLHRGIPDNGQP